MTDVDQHIRDCLPQTLADVLVHARPGAEGGYPGMAAIARLLHSGEATVEIVPDGYLLVIYPAKSEVRHGTGTAEGSD